MSLSKRSLAIGFLAVLSLGSVALAAENAQVDGDAVRRVAAHIACRCGACKDTMTCPMSMEGCGFCTPGRAKIARMQKAGFSDQAIIDSFMKEYGPDIYRAGPSNYFWMVPYGSLLLGAAAIFWFVSRYYKGAPIPAPAGGTSAQPDAEYARYREAIEKEVGKLEE